MRNLSIAWKTVFSFTSACLTHEPTGAQAPHRQRGRGPSLPVQYSVPACLQLTFAILPEWKCRRGWCDSTSSTFFNSWRKWLIVLILKLLFYWLIDRGFGSRFTSEQVPSFAICCVEKIQTCMNRPNIMWMLVMVANFCLSFGPGLVVYCTMKVNRNSEDVAWICS